MRASLRRLAKRAKDARLATDTLLGERWTREACRHLSDRELKLLQQALHRGFDPASAPEHQAVTIKGYTLCIATYKNGA